MATHLTRKILLALLSLWCAGQLFSDDTRLIGNPENRTQIDEPTLKSMLIGQEKFWQNGSEVVIAILKNDPNAEETLSRYCGMSSSKFKNHWMRMAYSGRGKMPKMFSNIDDLVDFVKTNKGAIAIAPLNNATKELRQLSDG